MRFVRRASKSGVNVRDPIFSSKMSGLYIQAIKTVSKHKLCNIKYLYALIWPIALNMGVFVTFIFIIWEKISPYTCFQQKCPDFQLIMSGILDPRIPLLEGLLLDYMTGLEIEILTFLQF